MQRHGFVTVTDDGPHGAPWLANIKPLRRRPSIAGLLRPGAFAALIEKRGGAEH
jgi:hypothetical protein